MKQIGSVQHVVKEQQQRNPVAPEPRLRYKVRRVCHAKIGPAQNWSGGPFMLPNMVPPGPNLLTKMVPPRQLWSSKGGPFYAAKNGPPCTPPRQG